MNGWVEAPPPKPMGCFAKGCLILAGFALFLAIACVAGIYWGMHRDSAVLRSFYWLSKVHAISDKPASLPPHEVSDEKIQTARERWNRFEAAARSGQTAEIELSADDLNDLIASDPEVRGKIFVSIEQNHLHLQISVPLNEFVRMRGYYFNSDITIELRGREGLSAPRLSSVTINNERLPSDLFEWKYRARRLRDYLAEAESPWTNTTVEIRDSKVILRANEMRSGE